AIVRILVGSRRPWLSDAFATWSYDTNDFDQPLSVETLVSAAVSVVLPWSTCPIVPTLQCGFSRLNFSLAMELSVSFFRTLRRLTSGELRLDLLGDRRGDLLVVIELHGEGGAPL